MSACVLDVYELYRRLDVKRRKHELTWKQIAFETGVSASTFTRLKDGKRPDADALVSIIAWLGIGIACVTVERGEE